MLAFNLSNTLSRALSAFAGSLSASDPIQRAHAAALDSNTYVTTVNELCTTARASNAPRKPTACRVNKASSRYARATAGLTLSSAFVASVKGDVKATGYLRVLVGEMGKAQVKAGEEDAKGEREPLVDANQKDRKEVESLEGSHMDAFGTTGSSYAGKTSFSRLFVKSSTTSTTSLVAASSVGIFGNSATRFSHDINVKTVPHVMPFTPSSSKIVSQLQVNSPVAWSTERFTNLNLHNNAHTLNEHVAAPQLALVLRAPGTMIVHRAHNECTELIRAYNRAEERSIEVETPDVRALAANTVSLVEVVAEEVVESRALVAAGATAAQQQLTLRNNNDAAEELAIAVRSSDSSALEQSPPTIVDRLAQLLTYDSAIDPHEVPREDYHTVENSIVRDLIDAVKAWQAGDLRGARLELGSAVEDYQDIERLDVFNALLEVGYTILGARDIARLAIEGEARWGQRCIAPQRSIGYIC